MSVEKNAAQYVPERGYWTGPTLEPGERPWPTGWEWEWAWDDTAPRGARVKAKRITECPHRWELVQVHEWNGLEPVVRCQVCHIPRCGHSDDRDPCMEPRHHGGVHIALHGSFEPVGGYLARPLPPAELRTEGERP